MSAPSYPVNLDVTGRACLVVGGGAVAAEKAAELARCGADVLVVAPELSDAVRAAGGCRLEERAYRRSEAGDYWFVVAATDDPATNQMVRDDGDAAGVWVNAADDPDRCSATLPARLRRGDLLVTFSTGGASPALSSWLRRQAEQQYGPEYGELVELVAEVRRDRRRQRQATPARGWHQAFDSGILDLVREGHRAAAKELLEACLSSSSA